MDKKEKDLELFKQALVEGVSAHFDRIVAQCPEDEVPVRTEEEKQEYIRKIIEAANAGQEKRKLSK
jgi:hypothetical protein